MNESRPPAPIPPHEWQAQERALRAERLHLSGHADDADARAYRAVARALRQPPQVRLPADFAAQVARLAASGRRDDLLDRAGTVLVAVLFVVFVIAGLPLLLAHGAAWWQSLAALLPDGAGHGPWLPALAACAGVTALLSRWRRVA